MRATRGGNRFDFPVDIEEISFKMVFNRKLVRILFSKLTW
jgi:hypothetical protein